ncbi:MAG: chemotaxis protein CheW [Gammaproteobacteria bacterium]|nr:chemotaxis protein CheW [Gammaproteobacteria bacterium]
MPPAQSGHATDERYEELGAGLAPPLADLEAPIALTTQADAQTSAVTRFGFRAADIGLLIAVQTVAQVVESPTIYSVPNAPEAFSGLLNLRGNLVPIFDPCYLFDKPISPAPHVLVIGRGETCFGLKVDTLPVALYPTSALPQMPSVPRSVRNFVQAAYLLANEVWLDINFPAYLAIVSHASDPHMETFAQPTVTR